MAQQILIDVFAYVAQRVESIAQMMERNHAATEETAVNTQKLKDLAASVKKTLTRFKV